MDKILHDVCRQSSPMDTMRIWAMAPDSVDVPETLALIGTTETEEFLWKHGSRIKHLTLFLNGESPHHFVHILPYCVGDTLETLDIRHTGFLDCYPLRYLPRLTTLHINAMHTKRCTHIPPLVTDLRLCMSSHIDIDVSMLTSLRTFHVTADKVTVETCLPDGINTFRVRGRSCTIPSSMPDSLEHLEVSGTIIDAFPTLPRGLRTLNVSNTHIEPGQLRLSNLDLDACIAYGTYLEDDDIKECRARLLDIRWTAVTHRARFHPCVQTVYMDMVPSCIKEGDVRESFLNIHIGQDPDHMSAACMVSMNNDFERRDPVPSPFLGQATYTKAFHRQRIACHIWSRTLRTDDVDRLLA